MSRRFSVQTLLKRRDHAAFHRMLLKSTIDEAVKWSRDRGYGFSRKAIWNYRRCFESSPLSPGLQLAVGRTACMERLYKILPRVSDGQLNAILVVAEEFASFSSKFPDRSGGGK